MKCQKCKHRTVYVAVKNPDLKIQICEADGWEDGEGESFNLMEISNFNSDMCMLFSEG